MMMQRTGIIYGLADPRYFDLIRYVGQTIGTLEDRFEKHMNRLDGNSHKANWIKKLLSLSLKPKQVILVYDIPVPFITYLQNDFAKNVKNRFQPFYDYDALDKEERYFISITREECSSFGIDCVNGTDGGDGSKGGHWKLTQEQCLARCGTGNSMSGKSCTDSMTEEEIELWKKHLSGKTLWNKGLTKETDSKVAQISESKMGHDVSRETRDKISKTLTGRPLSEEHKIHLGESGKIAQNRPEVKAAANSERNRGTNNPMSAINKAIRAVKRVFGDDIIVVSK